MCIYCVFCSEPLAEIFSNLGVRFQNLFSFFMFCKTLKTEVLRPSRHLTDRPVTRRCIPKGVVPL